MTLFEKIQTLKALAAKATPVNGKCQRCGFDLSYGHSTGCPVPEKKFSEAANPETVTQLCEALEEAVRTVEFYGSLDNYDKETGAVRDKHPRGLSRKPYLVLEFGEKARAFLEKWGKE